MLDSELRRTPNTTSSSIERKTVSLASREAAPSRKIASPLPTSDWHCSSKASPRTRVLLVPHHIAPPSKLELDETITRSDTAQLEMPATAMAPPRCWLCEFVTFRLPTV